MTHREHPAHDYPTVIEADTQLIDVREPDEFSAGSLPGARNIPMDTLLGDPYTLDTTRRVVLLCRSGRRSGRVAARLANIGFTDVVNLTGGMLAVDEVSGRTS